MSIRDYERSLIITNATTSQPIASLNYLDYSGMTYSEVTVKLPVYDLMIINAIHEAIDNDFACHIGWGYKKTQ